MYSETPTMHNSKPKIILSQMKKKGLLKREKWKGET